MRATAAVSIDLDGAHAYHAIHALPPPSVDVLVARGLERFLGLCATHAVRATLFVITRDLEDPRVRDLVRQAHDAGHEIASHSHTHRYDLSRASPAEIEADLARSIDALARLTGVRPRGFRAPGYNQSEALLDALEKLGFAYDSSFLHAPLYFGARAAVIGALRIAGRRSSSLVGDVRESWPSAPFRPRRGARTLPARSRVDGRDLIEVPMRGVAGVPWIGTTLALASHLHPALTRAALADPAPAVLELHAIDLCGPDEVDAALRRVQPDARVPLAHKQRVLDDTIAHLARVRDVVPVAELARAAAEPA